VGVALRQYGCLLDEGLARAFRLVATKPSNLQIDDCLATCDWQIAEIPFVAAVERFRPGAADRAACAWRFTADRKMHDLAAQLYLLDNEPSARRQQHLWIHRPPFGWPSDAPGRSGLPEQTGAAQVHSANLDITFARANWTKLRSSQPSSRTRSNFDMASENQRVRSRTNQLMISWLRFWDNSLLTS
jgi:hypothetical protein